MIRLFCYMPFFYDAVLFRIYKTFVQFVPNIFSWNKNEKIDIFRTNETARTIFLYYNTREVEPENRKIGRFFPVKPGIFRAVTVEKLRFFPVHPKNMRFRAFTPVFSGSPVQFESLVITYV